MAKSFVGQKTLLQKETTPGTAATNAMKQFTALSLIPGDRGDSTPFRAQGYRGTSANVRGDQWSEWTADGIQDFNHLGYVLASRIGTPVTTTPGGATNARQHVFTLDPVAGGTFATYTAQFGDTTWGAQSTFGVFNTLGMNIQRGSLSFDTSFIARRTSAIANIATTGVTVVPAAPMGGVHWGAFNDTTWAGLGTTRVLDVYEGGLDLGDRFTRDTPLNDLLTSFESMLEAEDQSHEGTLRVAVGTTSTGLVTSFDGQTKRYIQLRATGPIAEAAVNYSCKIDLSIEITELGDVEAFNNGTLTQNFSYMPMPDASNNFIRITLVNMVTAY